MPLISRAHIRLSRLRFPFTVRIQSEQGTVYLRDANGRHEVRPDNPFMIPAFTHFGYEIPGTVWQPCAITFKAVPDTGCPHMAVIQHNEPWVRAFATLVFEHPVQVQNAALLSHCWQACPRQMRARLFVEGEALHALMHEQHATWTLRRPAHTRGNDELGTEALHALTQRAGLRSARTLNETCTSLFGVELATLLAGNADLVSGLVHGSTVLLKRWAQPLTAAL